MLATVKKTNCIPVKISTIGHGKETQYARLKTGLINRLEMKGRSRLRSRMWEKFHL